MVVVAVWVADWVAVGCILGCSGLHMGGTMGCSLVLPLCVNIFLFFCTFFYSDNFCNFLSCGFDCLPLSTPFQLFSCFKLVDHLSR